MALSWVPVPASTTTYQAIKTSALRNGGMLRSSKRPRLEWQKSSASSELSIKSESSESVVAFKSRCLEFRFTFKHHLVEEEW